MLIYYLFAFCILIAQFILRIKECHVTPYFIGPRMFDIIFKKLGWPTIH